ncbi:Uma2 family endonuclease [uncultured Thiodictyon sp.]|jgi:Uma2 family endonuclease|uniref:Uma2 family endonuclease n=1 Tax=uncultured Thiodictyon sp. TaxID=1846217 RepID=UPI0025DD7277|nr:Uma2 family endonuclease [uncultured Thiodictyon sp.]
MSTAIAVPIEPPLAPGPKRHAITVNEYFRMGETGVLGPDARVELIEGDLIDMPPIGPIHAGKTNRLNRLLTTAVGAQAIVSTQNPVVLGRLTAPQPDLALLRYRDDYYELTHPGPEDCLLLIEVSESSLAHDRRTKLPLYARFRIPEVWIIDCPGRHFDVHLDPEEGRYTRRLRVTDLSRVEIAALPGVVLDLRTLF